MANLYGPSRLQFGLHIQMPVPQVMVTTLNMVTLWPLGSGQLKRPHKSLTWQELHAIRCVLESFQGKLKDERVCWFSYNQNAVDVVQLGSG